MDETRNEGRRGQAGESLMRARPTANAAALEELKRDIAALSAQVADRPDPLTREELEDWGTRFLERVDEAVRDGSGPESPPDPVAAQAGRLEAAAERVETVARADGERLAAIGETVSREHAVTRAGVTGVADVADTIAEDVIGLRRDLGNRTQTILARLPAPGAEADEVADGAEADVARPRRRVPVISWLLVLAAGMALESRTQYAAGFFHWLLQ